MRSASAIGAGLIIAAAAATPLWASPVAGLAGAKAPAAETSIVEKAHGWHRVCRPGRWGWHRHTRWGRVRCVPPWWRY